MQTAAATTSEEPTSSDSRAAPESENTAAPPRTVSTSTQSVQTTPQPLSVSEQRLALRKHVISKSTIRDVIQLEQVSFRFFIEVSWQLYKKFSIFTSFVNAIAIQIFDTWQNRMISLIISFRRFNFYCYYPNYLSFRMVCAIIRSLTDVHKSRYSEQFLLKVKLSRRIF